MMKAPPREPVWLSWVCVALCAIAIFLTIPFARDIVNFVYGTFGRQFFPILMYTTIIVVSLTVLIFLIRNPPERITSWLWLIAVAGGFTAYTWHLRSSPEEALHFIQYGLLGILLYRALTHQFHDLSVFLVAIFIGGSLGALDEAIQWLTPRRVWDIRDVIINFAAITFIQLAIANGFRPPLIERRFVRRSWLGVSTSLLGFAVFISACLMNTPALINHYVDHVPGIAQLKSKTSQMAEYGFQYRDPEFGIFQSRLDPKQLQETDRRRAVEAAAKLSKSAGREGFQQFIRSYTPLNDPFLHEVSIHIRSRDIHLRISGELDDDEADQRRIHLTHAFRQQLILEKYFPETLARSQFNLTAAQRVQMRQGQLTDYDYQSPVSRNLITGLSVAQMRWLVIAVLALILCFVVVSVRLRREE